MDTQRMAELIGHYVVMLILVFGALELIQRSVGDIGFWAELIVVIIIAFAYRPIVLRLGVAPTAWEEQ